MDRRAFRLLFALILVLRVAICAQPLVMYDAFSYVIVADAVSSGHDVYAATNRYNYSPAWSRVLAALWRLAGGEMMRFVLLVGLLLNAADAAAAVVVLRIGRRPGLLRAFEGDPRRLALLFFSNPISVFVTCTLRQFDGLAILFLLTAVLAAGRKTRRGRWMASLSLAASLLVKHVTALHPLVFARRRRAGLPVPFAALPCAVFAPSLLPHLASLPAIRNNVLLYGTGLTGARGHRPGGLQAFVAPGSGSHPSLWFAVFVVVVAAAIALGRGRPLPRACLLLSLAALAGAPGFAAQYLVWPIALGSLYPAAGYGVFTTLGALFMVSEARLVETPFAVPAAAAWLGAFVRLLLEVRSALEARRYDDGVAEALQTSSTASV